MAGGFPEDEMTYSTNSNYTKEFDYPLFAVNPFPSRGEVDSSRHSLFWCTWLVIASYNEKGYPILQTWYSPTMEQDFKDRHKFIEPDVAQGWNPQAPNYVEPGSVIFFDVRNAENRTDHVGLVYSVNGDDLLYLQSNAYTKDDSVAFSDGGIGLISPANLRVVGIGLP